MRSTIARIAGHKGLLVWDDFKGIATDAWSWLLARPQPKMSRPHRRIVTVAIWLPVLAALAVQPLLPKRDVTVAEDVLDVVLWIVIPISALAFTYLLFRSPVVRRRRRRR